MSSMPNYHVLPFFPPRRLQALRSEILHALARSPDPAAATYAHALDAITTILDNLQPDGRVPETIEEVAADPIHRALYHLDPHITPTP